MVNPRECVTKWLKEQWLEEKKLILSAVSKANSTARNVFLNFYPPSLSRAIKKRQKTNKVFMVLSLVAIVSSFEENRLE